MFWILQNLFIEFLIQVTKYHKEMVSFYDILNSNINKHYIHSDWIFLKQDTLFIHYTLAKTKK